MDEKTREKCFKNVIKEKIEKKEPIKSYDNFISSGLEKYFIDVKIINNMELLNFSILGILILTVSKHNLIYFSKEINEVISNLTFLTRKFVEIILSISLRLFSREKEKNLLIYKYYFDIYKVAIENKNIFPNDQLIKLQKAITKFINSIETKKYEIDFNNLNDIQNKNYKLNYNEKIVRWISFLEINEEEKLKKNLNIKFECNKKKYVYKSIYHIRKIYEIICNFIDDYYKNLDFNIIKQNKEEFNKIIIYLLTYVTIIKEENKRKQKENYLKNKNKNNDNENNFPKDIELFLINCLEQ